MRLPQIPDLRLRVMRAAEAVAEEGRYVWIWPTLARHITVRNPHTGEPCTCTAEWLRLLCAQQGIGLWQLQAWGREGKWYEVAMRGGKPHRFCPSDGELAPGVKRKATGAGEVEIVERPATFAAIDLEFTSSGKDGRIIEVGVVVFSDGEVVDSRSTLVNPEIPIPPIVQKVTGLTQGDVYRAPVFAAVAPALKIYLERAGCVVSHSSVDERVLGHAFGQLGQAPPSVEWVDSLARAKKLARAGLIDAPDNKLSTLCRHLAIDTGDGAWHRAEKDARACGLLLLEMDRRAKIAGEQRGLFERVA